MRQHTFDYFRGHKPERLRATDEQLAAYSAAHQGDGGTVLAPMGAHLVPIPAATGTVLGSVLGGEATNQDLAKSEESHA